MSKYEMLKYREEAMGKLKKINSGLKCQIEDLMETKKETEFRLYDDVNSVLVNSKESFEKELKEIKESYDLGYFDQEIESLICKINLNHVLVEFSLGGFRIECKFIQRFNPVSQETTTLEIIHAYDDVNDNKYRLQIPYKGYKKVKNLNEEKDSTIKNSIKKLREEIIPYIYEDNFRYDLKIKGQNYENN